MATSPAAAKPAGAAPDRALHTPSSPEPSGASAPRDPARTAGEQVLWQGTPSLKLLTIDAVLTGSFALLLIVGTIFTLPAALRTVAGVSHDFARTVAEHESDLRALIWLFVALTVAFRLGRLGWRALALRHQRYRLTSQRLTLETGVIGRRLVELDMRAVEDVTLAQTLTERLLGLGTIELTSSDTTHAPSPPFGAVAPQKGRLTLTGIASPREVREAIRNAAYQATQNQLFTRAT